MRTLPSASALKSRPTTLLLAMARFRSMPDAVWRTVRLSSDVGGRELNHFVLHLQDADRMPQTTFSLSCSSCKSRLKVRFEVWRGLELTGGQRAILFFIGA